MYPRDDAAGLAGLKAIYIHNTKKELSFTDHQKFQMEVGNEKRNEIEMSHVNDNNFMSCMIIGSSRSFLSRLQSFGVTPLAVTSPAVSGSVNTSEALLSSRGLMERRAEGATVYVKGKLEVSIVLDCLAALVLSPHPKNCLLEVPVVVCDQPFAFSSRSPIKCLGIPKKTLSAERRSSASAEPIAQMSVPGESNNAPVPLAGGVEVKEPNSVYGMRFSGLLPSNCVLSLCAALETLATAHLRKQQRDGAVSAAQTEKCGARKAKRLAVRPEDIYVPKRLRANGTGPAPNSAVAISKPKQKNPFVLSKGVPTLPAPATAQVDMSTESAAWFTVKLSGCETLAQTGSLAVADAMAANIETTSARPRSTVFSAATKPAADVRGAKVELVEDDGRQWRSVKEIRWQSTDSHAARTDSTSAGRYEQMLRVRPVATLTPLSRPGQQSAAAKQSVLLSALNAYSIYAR